MSFVSPEGEKVADVSFDQDALSVRLKDGRTISVPLAWYPRLFQATAEQRRNWKIAGGGYGSHWPEIDEDISTEELLRGAPAPVPPKSKAPLSTGRKTGLQKKATKVSLSRRSV